MTVGFIIDVVDCLLLPLPTWLPWLLLLEIRFVLRVLLESVVVLISSISNDDDDDDGDGDELEVSVRMALSLRCWLDGGSNGNDDVV